MHFALATIILALPLAICAPTNSKTITVLYRWEKGANEHGIAAFGESDNLIGHSCSQVLNTGSFAKAPISFNLTKDNSAGFITVDGSEHIIHANSQYSNGPTCNRVYNQRMVELECQVTLPSSFQGVALSANEVSCFKRLAKGIRVLNTALVDDPKYAANDTNFGMKEPKHGDITSRRNELVDRQCVVSYATEPQAKKDPWQRFLGKQLSHPHHCDPTHSCSVSASDGDIYTIGFDATVNFNEWISAGFSVGKSVTTSNTYTCDGNPGEVVCAWETIRFTQYNAQNVDFINCGGGTSTSTVRAKGSMKSPNDDRNWGTYCVVGTCRSMGQAYWAKDQAKAGGPGAIGPR